MTKRYDDANREYDRAVATFTEAQDAYRARTIGDAEYLRAREAFARATEVYDREFAIAAGFTTEGR